MLAFFREDTALCAQAAAAFKRPRLAFGGLAVFRQIFYTQIVLEPYANDELLKKVAVR